MAQVTSTKDGYFNDPGVFTSTLGSGVSALVGHIVCLKASAVMAVNKIAFSGARAAIGVVDGQMGSLTIAAASQAPRFVSVGAMQPAGTANIPAGTKA